MSGIAMAIVLTAAFLHAGWNYLTKKSQRKIVFIWWFLLIAVILYFPMFFYFWPKTTIPLLGWSCVVASGLLHGLYFWFLGGAYERGDLSLVYPLSRGSGPLFVPFLAVVLIHEQISFFGTFGISLVIFGFISFICHHFLKNPFLSPSLHYAAVVPSGHFVLGELLLPIH